MSFLHAIILGLIEGLTEFVPISSSGHLVIAHRLLGSGPNDLAIDAVIQMGTILAVLVYFWKDLWKIFFDFCKIVARKAVSKEDKIMVLAIILGTIPAALLGLLLESTAATVFRNVHLVALALIAGSILMFFADKYIRKHRDEKKLLTVHSGIMVGLFQCLAIIPGVSRSGATISGGFFQGFSREQATRFSFLLSFPIIFGAGMKEILDLHKIGFAFSMPFALSIIIAFAVGLWSISFLLKYLRTHDLNIFVWYRVFIALVILIFL